MFAKFSETRFESGAGYVRLSDSAGEVLLELRGSRLEDAVRAGFLDRPDDHYSVYRYARMIGELEQSKVVDDGGGPPRLHEDDNRFLDELDLRWD